MTRLKEGVYEITWGTQIIRLIVLSQIPKIKRNAIWQLFSGNGEKVQYGAAQYKWRRKDHSTIIRNLYNSYKAEGIAMPYDWPDFYRQFVKENLNMLRPEERLKGLRPEEWLKGLRAEQRLKGLRPEERLKGLRPEQRLKGLRPEERLKGLRPEEIEAYLKKLRKKQRKSR